MAGLPGLHATNAIVSVLLAAGAALVFGLSRPWARRPSAPVMLTPLWLGSVVSVSHGLYGLVTKGLYLAGAHSAVSWPEPLTAAQKNHTALLDLGVFEPWFLIQGLLLLFAGRWFARTTGGRRWWALSLTAGVVLVDAFGIVLLVAGERDLVGCWRATPARTPSPGAAAPPGRTAPQCVPSGHRTVPATGGGLR